MNEQGIVLSIMAYCRVEGSPDDKSIALKTLQMGE